MNFEAVASATVDSRTSIEAAIASVKGALDLGWSKGSSDDEMRRLAIVKTALDTALACVSNTAVELCKDPITVKNSKARDVKAEARQLEANRRTLDNARDAHSAAAMRLAEARAIIATIPADWTPTVGKRDNSPLAQLAEKIETLKNRIDSGELLHIDTEDGRRPIGDVVGAIFTKLSGAGEVIEQGQRHIREWVSERLDNVTTRLEGVGGRVEAFAGRIEALGGRIDTLAATAPAQKVGK